MAASGSALSAFKFLRRIVLAGTVRRCVGTGTPSAANAALDRAGARLCQDTPYLTEDLIQRAGHVRDPGSSTLTKASVKNVIPPSSGALAFLVLALAR